MPRRTPGIRFLFLYIILAVFAIIIHPGNGFADHKKLGPEFAPSSRPTAEDGYQTSTPKLIGESLINFFSRWISPIDGPRSPSYPTGSAYGREAISKHGLAIGIILTADRLIHEADVHTGPRITLYGKTRYYDPVEANTYWWDDIEAD